MAERPDDDDYEDMYDGSWVRCNKCGWGRHGDLANCYRCGSAESTPIPKLVFTEPAFSGRA